MQWLSLNGARGARYSLPGMARPADRHDAIEDDGKRLVRRDVGWPWVGIPFCANRFDARLYLRYREYRAALGLGAVLAVLVAELGLNG